MTTYGDELLAQRFETHRSRSRKSRRQEPLDALVPNPIVGRKDGTDPEHEALLAVLDPEAVLRADHAAVEMGATKEVRGAAAVAESFAGRARFAQPALVNGAVGAVWAPGGQPRVVFGFTITRGKIAEIDLVTDPQSLGQLDLVILED